MVSTAGVTVVVEGNVDVEAHPAKDQCVVKSWTTPLQAVVLVDRHEEEGGRGRDGEVPGQRNTTQHNTD